MQQVPLKDICKIGNGFAFKSSEYLDKGIPLLRISNLINERVYFNDSAVYVDDKYLQSRPNFLVEKGDVVIALSGATTGKYAIYDLDYPSLLNQRIGIIKANSSSKIESKFFYYYLGKLRSEILRMAGGAAQPNISTKELGNFLIPLPPLKTQQKIAAILDEADRLRRLNKKLIAIYEQLGQSLFLEMFGDPVSNPRGWPTMNAETYSHLITVGVVIKPASYYVPDGVPALRGQNIKENHIDLTNLVYFSKADNEKKLSKSKLNYLDVVIVRTGQTGTAAVIPKKLEGINCIDLVILRPNLKIVNPYYLTFFFNSDRGKQIVLSHNRGQIQQHFNVGSAKKVNIPIPPIEIQNQFSNQLNEIEKQKIQAQQALEHSEELFNSLLQKAFKGELV